MKTSLLHTYKAKGLLMVTLLAAMLVLNLASTPQDAQAQTPPQQAAPLPAFVRWGYYVKQQTSLDSIRQNIGNLDIVSPGYFNLNADGTITGSDTAEVTALAKSRNVRVVPMVQNINAVKEKLTALLSNPASVRRMIDQLDALITQYNYDGIHIDFEDINATDRPLVTSFMGQLYQRLSPKRKLTTQALVAKTRDATTGFGGSYDYAALAQYLDFAVVMAYDFHYRGGTDGPVAPLTWVRSVAAFASSQLGAGKVILGMPFYGYDWNLSMPVGVSRTVSRGYDDAIETVRKYAGTNGYDPIEQEAFADYIVSGQPHRMWYQNPQSIAARIQVVKDNRLAGFGGWRIGHEGQGFWAVIRNYTLPTQPIAAFASTPTRTYFAQTQHSLGNAFKTYWDKNGGLSQFGYPWTEEFQEINPTDGQVYTVQYFERARFEYHPEFKGTPAEVLLGLLGKQVTTGRDDETPFRPIAAFQSTDTRWYIPQTGHSLSFGFKDYWLKNGGIYIYGYPTSEEFQEVSPTDGRTYTVQYFERNRFEYHPEYAGTKSAVLLGLLGNQVMKEYGWLRPEV